MHIHILYRMLTFYDNVSFTQQQISTILTEISDLSLLWKLRKTLFPVLCIVSTELTGVPMLRSNSSIKPATTLFPFQCKLNEAFSVNVEIWTFYIDLISLSVGKGLGITYIDASCGTIINSQYILINMHYRRVSSGSRIFQRGTQPIVRPNFCEGFVKMKKMSVNLPLPFDEIFFVIVSILFSFGFFCCFWCFGVV